MWPFSKKTPEQSEDRPQQLALSEIEEKFGRYLYNLWQKEEFSTKAIPFVFLEAEFALYDKEVEAIAVSLHNRELVTIFAKGQLGPSAAGAERWHWKHKKID